MFKIKLSSGVEFFGETLDRAQEKYISYHVDHSLEPAKISKIMCDREELEKEDMECIADDMASEIGKELDKMKDDLACDIYEDCRMGANEAFRIANGD